LTGTDIVPFIKNSAKNGALIHSSVQATQNQIINIELHYFL